MLCVQAPARAAACGISVRSHDGDAAQRGLGHGHMRPMTDHAQGLPSNHLVLEADIGQHALHACNTGPWVMHAGTLLPAP